MAGKLGQCPPDVKDMAKRTHNIDLENSIPPNVQENLVAAGINWQRIFQALQQFGPVVIQILISLFGGTPAQAVPGQAGQPQTLQPQGQPQGMGAVRNTGQQTPRTQGRGQGQDAADQGNRPQPGDTQRLPSHSEGEGEGQRSGVSPPKSK